MVSKRKTSYAETNFSLIENILRKNITSNQLESAKWLITKMLSSAAEEDKAGLLEGLKQLEQEDPRNHGIESIIEKLKIKHTKLRQDLNVTLVNESTSPSYQPTAYNFFEPAFEGEKKAGHTQPKAQDDLTYSASNPAQNR